MEEMLRYHCEYMQMNNIFNPCLKVSQGCILLSELCLNSLQSKISVKDTFSMISSHDSVNTQVLVIIIVGQS